MSREGCPSCDRDLSSPGVRGHECYTYAEQAENARRSLAGRALIRKTDTTDAGKHERCVCGCHAPVCASSCKACARVRALINNPKDAHYPIVSRDDVRAALDGDTTEAGGGMAAPGATLDVDTGCGYTVPAAGASEAGGGQ